MEALSVSLVAGIYMVLLAACILIESTLSKILTELREIRKQINKEN